MTAYRVTTDEDLALVQCSVCGFRLLVEPDAQAILMHHPDASHRLVGYRLEPMSPDVVPRDEVAALRAQVLGLAVRLQDIADDLASLLVRLQ